MSTDHVCVSPGCKITLVLDGNMKNARQVSMVKDVAQLHFLGMPGAVVVGKKMKLFPFIAYCFPWSMPFNLLGIANLFEIIGCQNTCAKGSRYCPQHCGTAMTFRDDMENVVEPQGVPRIDEHGRLVTKILNEKKTRQGIIYEVS